MEGKEKERKSYHRDEREGDLEGKNMSGKKGIRGEENLSSFSIINVMTWLLVLLHDAYTTERTKYFMK